MTLIIYLDLIIVNGYIESLLPTGKTLLGLNVCVGPLTVGWMKKVSEGIGENAPP
jgi:hypothetical protein